MIEDKQRIKDLRKIANGLRRIIIDDPRLKTFIAKQEEIFYTLYFRRLEQYQLYQQEKIEICPTMPESWANAKAGTFSDSETASCKVITLAVIHDHFLSGQFGPILQKKYSQRSGPYYILWNLTGRCDSTQTGYTISFLENCLEELKIGRIIPSEIKRVFKKLDKIDFDILECLKDIYPGWEAPKPIWKDVRVYEKKYTHDLVKKHLNPKLKIHNLVEHNENQGKYRITEKGLKVLEIRTCV